MENIAEDEDIVLLSQLTPGLTREEEQKYFPLARNGDTKAYEYIVLKNINLVKEIANHYRYEDQNCSGYEDLVQEGILGLCRAVSDYDENMGCRFSTYAVNWIKQKMLRYVANKRYPIRVPIHILERYRPLMTALSKMEKESGSISYEDTLKYAESKGFKGSDLAEFLLYTKTVSSNDVISEGEKLGDKIERWESFQADDDIEEDYCYKELKDLINLAMVKSLNSYEIDIVSRRYGLNGRKVESLNEIAKDHNVTREAIRQTQKRAVEKIKKTGLLNDYKYFER